MGCKKLLNHGGKFGHPLLCVLESVFHLNSVTQLSLLGPFIPHCCCEHVTQAQVQREGSGWQRSKKVSKQLFLSKKKKEEEKKQTVLNPPD